VVRVRHDDAQREAASGGIDADFAEGELAGLRVFRAVLEQDGHRQVGRSGHAAPRELLAQLQPLGARLREVDVDRIELLHRRERLGLVGRDESPLRDRRLADAPVDRRRDPRVVEDRLGARRLGLRGLELGLRLAQCRGRVLVVLLAHCVDLDQLRAALGVE
jgi:hypothetical protein